MPALDIDCSTVVSLDQIHDIISSELSFPSWYGRNFDALHDCLTDISVETVIRLNNFSRLYESIGRKADILKRVLTKASEENTSLSVTFE